MPLKATPDEVRNGQMGDWAFADGAGPDYLYLIIRLPNGSEMGDEAALPIFRHGQVPSDAQHPYWLWDGSREAPTLEPSILNRGSGQEWHGYLRTGQLVTA